MRSRLRVLALLAGILVVAVGAVGCSSSAAQTSGGGGPTRGPVTGTVVVKSGGKVVCVITLSAGRGSCKVSTKGYPAGSTPFTATYSGTKQYKPSTSKPVTVQLGKAAS